MTSPNQRFPRQVPLDEIAEVFAGYSEKKSSDRGRGPLRILQARDLGPASEAAADGEVRWHQLARCESKPGAERARLLSGDILLTARAADPRANLLVDVPADVVVGSSFAVLRCRPGVVDGRFLCWLLDAEGTRQRLRAELRGSSIPFLGVAELKRFSIALPPLSRQRAIASVQALRRRQAVLALRLDRAMGQLLEAAADLPAS